MPIHRVVDRNHSRFILLREGTGAIAADGFTPPTDAAIEALVDRNGETPAVAGQETVQIFDCNQMEKIKVFWTGTTPGGTATIETWVRSSNGLGVAGTWTLIASTAGVAPNTHTDVIVNGACQCFIRIGGAPSGTELRVKGYGFTD